MMAEAEQRAFMNTAVFRGGFSRQAGQKVAGAGLRQLQSLLNKALLERSAGRDRYLTHELLRQFAAERLQQSGDQKQVRQEHSAYYLTYLANQLDKLKGAEQLPTLKEIEEDFENIRQAWEQAVSNRAYDLVYQAVEAMYLFCFLRSRLEDGKSLFERARQGLAPASGEAPHPVWLAAGIRFYSVTDGQEVKQLLEKSLAHAREREDEMEEAYCLNTLATIAHYVDQDPPQAIALYEACAAIYRRLGERYYLAQTVSKMGEAYQLIGRTELTFQYVNEALELQRQTGDYIGESETLRALSMTAFQAGYYEDGLEYQEEAFAIQLRTNYVVGQATSNLYLGGFKFYRGEYEEGVIQAQLGLAQALEIADFSTQAWSYTFLTLMRCKGGDYAGARQDLERAKAIVVDPFRQTGAGNPFLQLFINVGEFLLCVAGGDFESARGFLLQPLNLAVMTNSAPGMTIVLPLTALLLGHNGRSAEAVEILGLTLSEPDPFNVWLREYAPLISLQSELQERLGREEFDASWKRGQTLDSMAIAKQILGEIESSIGQA
jgi:tetratricopeptide (TPR) repeat protein